MAVTVRYGLGNQIQKNLSGSCAGAIRRDRTLQSALGYTDNVDVKVNGMTVADDYVVRDNDVISLETRASSKA